MRVRPTTEKETMKKTARSRYLLAAVLVLLAAAAIYGYREFRREKKPVEKIPAAFSLTAADLIRDFSADEVSAGKKYAGKVIEVEGILKGTDITTSGHRTVVIGDGSSGTSLRFSMDSSFSFDPASLQSEMKLRMKGVCTGYIPDELGIGADIIFNQAVVAESNGKRTN
jgi:hypothetical protein